MQAVHDLLSAAYQWAFPVPPPPEGPSWIDVLLELIEKTSRAL